MVDYGSVGYQIGRLTGYAIMVALAVWVILIIRRNNAQQRAMRPSRDPRADLALLSITVTLHAAAEQALALVSGVATASGRLVPVAGGSTPAWWIDGGYPVVTLEHTAAGSVLAVRELVIPLPSPHGAILWDWVITQVEQASARGGVPTSRSGQRFVLSRPIDAHSAVWSSVG